MRFTTYDRWGNQTGSIQNVIEAVHGDSLQSIETLTLTLPKCDLVKGDRIVWRDKFLNWHEVIVSQITDTHEDGKLTSVVYCEGSMSEMLTDYIVELRPYNVTAAIAMQRALANTRWAVGTVSVSGDASASLYHMSVLEALTEIANTWGGELYPTIQVSGTGVVSRSVNLGVRGNDYGKRFEWTKDMTSIAREVSTDDVCTALYGYGKGLEAFDEDGDPTGGYHRKLTFGEINGGLDYVADETAKQTWGLPDGEGGIKHTFGKVEFDDCEDMTELLALTTEELQRRKQPQVSYTATVIDLADMGYAFEDVRTGDVVQVVDKELGVRVSGRVLEVNRHLFDEDMTTVTLGNLNKRITDVISQALHGVRSLADHAGAWDGAASGTATYVRGLISNMNDTINQTGGYFYVLDGDGVRTYDRPVTDPTEGDEATAVVEIKGGTIRIANSRTSQGEWDWKTVFTSGHIAAELVTAAQIVAGYIGSSGDTYIDLDNHTVQLGLSTGPHVVVNSTGMQVYNGSTSLGFFGVESNVGIVRIGQASQGNVVMSSVGYVDVRNGSTVLAHFGYGEGKDQSGGTSIAPYYDIGTRKANTTIGNNSVVEGSSNTASAFATHAEGYSSVASANYAHAEGYDTDATASGAHAQGHQCVASGDYSFAGGYNCTASGKRSTAIGYGCTAGYDDQFVVGIKNASSQYSLFIVGGGVYGGTGRNEFTVEKGTAHFFSSTYTGTVYVNGSSVHSSDRRLKKHHAYLGDDAVEFVRSLKPALFTKDGGRHVGFYAQDVQDAEPDKWQTETVVKDGFDESLGYAPLSLDYQALIAPLTAYAQYLERRIEELADRIE